MFMIDVSQGNITRHAMSAMLDSPQRVYCFMLRLKKIIIIVKFGLKIHMILKNQLINAYLI